MPYRTRSAILKGCGALAALALCAPLGATVRDGVDAWSRGDYAAAVAEWIGPAEAGDPDAMFNMGQAYRLGRGVPQDMQQAEQFYLRAAQAGHLQAADTYGLMLFQDGRREEALPYVQAASDRGDPRAQYLLGLAYFNGDFMERDWERAYALVSLAHAAGLPQAATAIEQMDGYIPLEQRQAAAALARTLDSEAGQARSVQLAAADLGESPAQRAEPSAPSSITSVAVSPSVVAAQDALEQARRATGTETPAQAGASITQEEAPAPAPDSEPADLAAAPQPDPAPEPAPVSQEAEPGPWRVQLGAFGVEGNAERLWERLSDRPEIAGRERLFIPSGRVTVVQAGGYASRADAQAACSSLQGDGFECLVTRN